MEQSDMQTVEMFGKSIEYDGSKLYGGYDDKNNYRELSIESTLTIFAKAGNKEHVLNYLNLI